MMIRNPRKSDRIGLDLLKRSERTEDGVYTEIAEVTLSWMGVCHSPKAIMDAVSTAPGTSNNRVCSLLHWGI